MNLGDTLYSLDISKHWFEGHFFHFVIEMTPAKYLQWSTIIKVLSLFISSFLRTSCVSQVSSGQVEFLSQAASQGGSGGRAQKKTTLKWKKREPNIITHMLKTLKTDNLRTFCRLLQFGFFSFYTSDVVERVKLPGKKRFSKAGRSETQTSCRIISA